MRALPTNRATLLLTLATGEKVAVSGDRERRIPNELLHPGAGPWIAAEQRARGVPTTSPDGRAWLPKWAWLDWTIAEHVACN